VDILQLFPGILLSLLIGLRLDSRLGRNNWSPNRVLYSWKILICNHRILKTIWMTYKLWNLWKNRTKLHFNIIQQAYNFSTYIYLWRRHDMFHTKMVDERLVRKAIFIFYKNINDTNTSRSPCRLLHHKYLAVIRFT